MIREAGGPVLFSGLSPQQPVGQEPAVVRARAQQLQDDWLKPHKSHAFSKVLGVLLSVAAFPVGAGSVFTSFFELINGNFPMTGVCLFGAAVALGFVGRALGRR